MNTDNVASVEQAQRNRLCKFMQMNNANGGCLGGVSIAIL